MSKLPMFKFLDTVGDGSGSTSANVNGAITPVVFKMQPAAGEIHQLHRLIIHYRDTGVFDAEKYGNGIVVTNGVLVQILKKADDSVILDLTGGLPITVNAHWARLSYDVRIDAYGIGDEYLTARWTFSRSGGPISVSDDEYFAVTLRDDFTGLIDQTFMLQGRIIK